MQNLSCENEFDLHENESVGETHFHMNGFTRSLVLTLRHKVSRKWPIVVYPRGKYLSDTSQREYEG